MTFRQITFWGGLRYRADGWYLRRGATYYHRLFKWGTGYSYATHRPPTVLDPDGHDLRDGNRLRGLTRTAGIHLITTLLLPKQDRQERLLRQRPAVEAPGLRGLGP
jgi:hypothetical protein